ncbi:hypothetical protein MBLNU13_g07987t1 [Cladosporium sp. NU13]
MSASRILSRTLASSALHRSLTPPTSAFRSATTTFRSSTLFNHNITNTTTKRNFSATMSTSTGVHNLTTKADFDAALGEKGLMVVDFFATWCGPCKVIAPQVVKFSNNYTDARFYKVDVDEVPEVAQEQSVRAMPTFLLYKDGKQVGEVVGANPVALEAAIKTHSA